MTDWITDIASYVRTNAVSFGNEAFAYQLPEGRGDPAVVIAPPTEGIPYNEELPDRYRGQYRAVVTTKSIADAYRYAEEILRLLTLFNTQVGSFTVMRSFPLRTPIPFPKANSDLYEVSIPFEVIMVDRRIRVGDALVSTSALSMGTFSLAAQGVLAINGGAAMQLNPFSALGAGEGPTGNADMTLQPFLLSGVSTTSIAAVLSSTIDAFSMSGTGASSAFPGQLISTLAEFAINANATTRIEMSGGYTMGDFSISGAAKPGITGSTVVTLGDFTANASAVTFFPATATITMDDFTVNASAGISTDGSANVAMDDFGLTANADMPLTGGLTLTFPALTLAGSAPMTVDASAIMSMDAFTLAATDGGSVQGSASLSMGSFGLIASADLYVEASVSASLGDFTITSSAETNISGSAVMVMGDFTASSTAATFLPAIANIQMDDFTVSGSVAPARIDGSAAATMGDFTSSGLVRLVVDSNTSIGMDDFSLAASGGGQIGASAGITLDPFNTSSASNSRISGLATMTLGDFGVSAVSNIDIDGSVSTAIGEFTASGSGGSPISGSTGVTMDTFTLTGASDLVVTAAATMSLDAFTVAATASLGSGSSNETETDALIARMTTAPDSTLEGHINTLIKAIKDTGAFSILDRFYIPCLHTEQASLLDWTGNGPDITVSGIATWSANKGIPIAGSGYGDTGISDLSTLTHFDATGRNGHWGAAWHTINSGVDSRCIRDGANKTFCRTDQRTFRIFGGSNGQFPAPAANEGVAMLVTASVTDNMEEHFSDGVLRQNDTSPGVDAATGYFDLGRNNNAAGNTAVIAGWWIGGKLTRQQGLDITAAVKTFLDAVLVYP